MNRFFTSEAVTEGHPDKICDQTADAILDALLAADPDSRCACEVICEPQKMHIMGEITSKASVDYPLIVRSVIRRIGYTKPEYGFDADSCAITCSLHEQSPDIAMGVDSCLEQRDSGGDELGAGDQGMMFGFACDETDVLMPAPIMLAQLLCHRLADVRRDGTLPWLRPDGKSQVTVEYSDGRPVRIDTVVLSAQHDPDVAVDELRDALRRQVIDACIPAALLDERTKYYINPTGRFVLGGPAADTGLTGRKIIADTYGGSAAHGGGAFSGKDPTKVDRSASYMARRVARTIVASGAARRCEVQLSYAIGVAQPVSVFVDTRGSGLMSDEALCEWVKASYDLRPAAIIEELGLRRPIYLPCAAYGCFGRKDIELPWELPDERAQALSALL